MAATAGRDALLTALQRLRLAIELRATIPILQHVKLRAGFGRLKLTATDLDIEAEADLEAGATEYGTCTTHLQTLLGIVKASPIGSIFALRQENERLLLQCGSMSASLFTLPAADFPAMPEVAFEHRFEIAADVLRGMIQRTRFAISTEETRYYLNGIYLHARADDLVAVATDGHRLAEISTPLPVGAADMPGAIVPRKAVSLLREVLGRGAAAVQVSISSLRVQFASDGFVVNAKAIDGTYPDYAGVIPTSNDRLMRVDRRKLLAAVKRVGSVLDRRFGGLKVTISPGRMLLSAASPDDALIEEAVESETHGIRDLELGVNHRYLREALEAIGGEVAFRFLDPSAPVLIADTADARLRIVLMPMRV